MVFSKEQWRNEKMKFQSINCTGKSVTSPMHEKLEGWEFLANLLKGGGGEIQKAVKWEPYFFRRKAGRHHNKEQNQQG